MQSVPVDAFFSCSFQAADKDVNDRFLAICRALDIRCINVSLGYSALPAEKAKEFIQKSDVLIAVCVKRDELKTGIHSMPQAVRDEISMAYSLDIPMLLLVEDGVKTDGFMDQYGTRLQFKRDDIDKNDFLEKVIASIHGIKLEAVSPDHLAYSQDDRDVRAEYMRHRVELMDKGDDEYEWRYTTAKRVDFSGHYRKAIITKVWTQTAVELPESAKNIQWTAKTIKSSRSIQLIPEIKRQTPECVEVNLRFDPDPEPGDYVEYSTLTSSPYLNPIWMEDIKDGSTIHLGEKEYSLFDGVVPVQRTKTLLFEMRLPASYGISKNDLKVFAGRYTSGIDYEVESEIKRSTVTLEDFGGDITVRIQVESPLVGHMYGVAWNPHYKHRK